MRRSRWLALFIAVAALIFVGRKPRAPGAAEDLRMPKLPSPLALLKRGKRRESESGADSTSPARRPASIATGSEQQMIETLSRFTRGPEDLKSLIQFLESSQQKPVVTRNANPDTGEMFVVRTAHPPAGTRYFHAQYFTGEEGTPFVQHMSVEFRPGPEAMDNTVAWVKQSFALGAPDVRRDDYALWNLPDRHVLWVKKMNAEDLRDDPFNAYGADDTGTIRVAYEAEIH